MKLTSPDFENGGLLPLTSGYQSGNKRPTLLLADKPETAASLAVVVHDPDAPNSDFCHWLAWNFMPHITNIPADNLPASAQEGTNDFGEIGYSGPAPPSGTHHYHFTVYALKKPLDLPPETTKAKLLATMQDHILDSAELIGTFSAD